MSTIASTERLDQRPIGGKGLSFLTLLHVELRKQVDTRGGRGLLIAIAVVVALVLALTMYFSRHDGASFRAFAAATATPSGYLIPALGVMTACNEWSQRTALITFTQEPRRWRVLVAKTLAAMIWATGFLLLAWVLAAFFHMITASIADVPMDWNMTASGFFAQWAGQMVSVLMGMAIGMLLLITPLALATYYVAPGIITMIVALISQKIVPWISQTAPPIGNDPLLDGMGVPSAQGDNLWAKFAVSMLVWVVIPYAVGFVRVLKREVK